MLVIALHVPNLPNTSCHPQLHLEVPKVHFTCIAIDAIGKLPTTS